MNCSSELKGPESLKLSDASVISGSRLEPEFLCENLCSYMYPIECISPLLLTLVSACSPSYRPAQRAVLGRPAFLHTVCICPFSSFFANAPSLPPSCAFMPIRLFISAPKWQQANRAAWLWQYYNTNGAFLPEIWLTLILSEGCGFLQVLKMEGKGLRCRTVQ